MLKLSRCRIGMLLVLIFISRSALGHWKPDTEVKIDDSQFRYSIQSYMTGSPLSIDVPRAVLLDPAASVDITTGLLEKMGSFTNAIACGSFRPDSGAEQCHPISLNLSKTGSKSIRLTDIKYIGNDIVGDNNGRMVLHLIFEKNMDQAAREIVKNFALQQSSPVYLQSVQIHDLEVKGIATAYGITSTSWNTPVCFGKCIATQIADGTIDTPKDIFISGRVNEEVEFDVEFIVRQNTNAILPRITIESNPLQNIQHIATARTISHGWENSTIDFVNKYKVKAGFTMTLPTPYDNYPVATVLIIAKWY